jgi:hypothetical protein
MSALSAIRSGTAGRAKDLPRVHIASIEEEVYGETQSIADLSLERPLLLTIDNASGLDKLLAQLDSLKNLPEGWDSYSALAPHAMAVENAKALVNEAGELGTEPERVEPSAMGGVGVTFSAGGREVVIEFYNNGTAHALFSNDATGDMSTRAVSTDSDGYIVIIGKVRKYLYGKKNAT